MSWSKFLESAPPAGHGVQIYRELDELSASVGRFLDAGFAAGEPGLVIAAPEHRSAFHAELARLGHDVEELEARGLLTFRDANETLGEIMDGGRPSAARFEKVVGGLLDEIAQRAPGKTVRAFGEMVDILVRAGNEAAAIALEELWNSVLATRRFALLCAYQLDVFDLGAQTSALTEIFRTHTHPRPVSDTARLADAVDASLTEVVGAAEAARIYLQVALEVPRNELPRAQALLTWLSSNAPETAERVLSKTRVRYDDAA